MLDWLLKIFKQLIASPAGIFCLVLILLLCGACYYFWRKEKEVGGKLAQLAQSHSDMQRQMAHGVVLDNDEDQIDLRWHQRQGDDRSEYTDDTPPPHEVGPPMGGQAMGMRGQAMHMNGAQAMAPAQQGRVPPHIQQYLAMQAASQQRHMAATHAAPSQVAPALSQVAPAPSQVAPAPSQVASAPSQVAPAPSAFAPPTDVHEPEHPEAQATPAVAESLALQSLKQEEPEPEDLPELPDELPELPVEFNDINSEAELEEDLLEDKVMSDMGRLDQEILDEMEAPKAPAVQKKPTIKVRPIGPKPTIS